MSAGFQISVLIRSFAQLLLLALTPLLSAYTAGDKFKSNNSQSYTLVKHMGDGYFGEVWVARDDKTQSQFAVKFFKPEKLEQATLDMYAAIALQQRRGRLKNLVRTYEPEVFSPQTPSGNSPAVYVVRLELGSSNVANLRESHFDLTATKAESDRVEKISEVNLLMHSALDGVLELKEAGLNHHDLNPKNILLINDRYVIGDLDEIRVHGEKPRTGAFEFGTGPIDYQTAGYHYDDDNISDLHQLANSLYQMLFGKSRLEEILLASPFDSLENLRNYLAQSKEFKAYDESTIAELDRKRKQYFPDSLKLSESDRAEINEVFEFLRAGLLLDSQERRTALSKLSMLRNFDLNYEAAISNARNPKEFVETVSSHLRKIDVSKREVADQNILRELVRFKSWQPSAYYWLLLKSQTRHIGTCIAIMKAQLGNSRRIEDLKEVVKHGINNPNFEFLTAIDQHILIPAIDSAKSIKSVDDAIDIASMCSTADCAIKATKAGIPYAQNLRQFLSMIPQRIEDEHKNYKLAIQALIAEHALTFVSTKDDLRTLNSLDSSLINNQARQRFNSHPKNSTLSRCLGWIRRSIAEAEPD